MAFAISCNIYQIFDVLTLDIAICSLEVCDVHSGAAEVNITTPRMNKFDIQQEGVLNICFIVYPLKIIKQKWIFNHKNVFYSSLEMI